MTDPLVVAEVRGVVHVTHHLLLLVPNGDHPGGAVPAAPNGLVATTPRCAAIYTGVHSGPVDVTIQVRRGPPVSVDDGWDDIVETDLRMTGDVQVATVLGPVPESFHGLTWNGGSHRLRVHARGRDNDFDGTATEAFEYYLIQVWPAPRAQEVMMHSQATGPSRPGGA